MTKKTVICDACKSAIKSDGFSVSISAGAEELEIDIKSGIDTAWENHYCGKACIIGLMNGLVDKINGAVVREHEHAPLMG